METESKPDGNILSVQSIVVLVVLKGQKSHSHINILKLQNYIFLLIVIKGNIFPHYFPLYRNTISRT